MKGHTATMVLISKRTGIAGLAVLLSSVGALMVRGGSEREETAPPGVLEAEQFVYAFAEETTLATVTYISSISVERVLDLKDEGYSEIEATIEDVSWEAASYWDLGVEKPYAAPESGDFVRLVVADDMGMAKGDRLVVGVSGGFSASPTSSGQVKVVFGDSIDTSAESSGRLKIGFRGASERMVYLYEAASDRLLSEAPEVVVEQMVVDARGWIDSINRLDVDDLQSGLVSPPTPGGVLASPDDKDIQPDRLAEYLDREVAHRQLPLVEDLLPGVSKELGLEERLVTFVFDDLEGDLPAYVGLRFEGVGIIGPWAVDAKNSYVSLTSLVPQVLQEPELLLWYSAEPLPGEEIVARVDGKFVDEIEKEGGTGVLVTVSGRSSEFTTAVVEAWSVKDLEALTVGRIVDDEPEE